MKDKWFDFINRLDLEEHIKNKLIAGTNIELKANKEKRKLDISLDLKEFISLEDIIGAEKTIGLFFQPYNVSVMPFYIENSNIDLVGITKYLNYRITNELPFFPLGSLNFCKDNNTIEVVLPSDFHSEIYSKKGIHKQIEKLLNKTICNKDLIKIKAIKSDNYSSRLKDIKNRTQDAIDENKNTIINKPVKVKKISAENANKVNEEGIILGTLIADEIIPAEAKAETIKNIAMFGKIQDLDIRNINKDKFLISFNLIWKKSGIPCKLFIKKNSKQPVLKNGLIVSIRGKLEYDNYKHDFVLGIKDINEYKITAPRDNADTKRVELHLHTKMSFLDANIDLKDLFKRMEDMGHDTVAITDHGVVQTFPEAYELTKDRNIKVIYGVEGYLFDDIKSDNLKGKTYHVIILVENQIGLKNLYTLISESHLNYFYRKPRIPKSLLIKHREGLIIGSACEAGEVFKGIVNKLDEENMQDIVEFYDYLEIQPISNNEYMVRNGLVETNSDLINFNKDVIKWGERSNKPVVATGDVHFLDKEDSIYRAILMKSKGFSDVIQPDLYYRSTEEMLLEFDYLSKEKAYEVVVKNPRIIANRVGKIRPVPVGLFTPKIEGAEEQVKEITYRTAHEIYGEKLPDIVEARIEKELNSIISNGFAVLYLIAHKLVKKSNEDGYVVGSRGSVGSSFVATLMGITEVNPLSPHYICPSCCHSEFVFDEYDCGIELPPKKCPNCNAAMRKDGFNIPFETFLGIDGDKIPDIDLNFSGEYQGKIHKYTEELFGKGNVFKAGTISTVAEKTAIGYVKKYYEEENIGNPRDIELISLASGCVGVKKTTGQHPGGLVIVPENIDIHDFTPVQRPADDINSDITTTHFDYHSIDSCLVKLDLLGHDDPTMIKYLEEMTGIKAEEIPLDDEDTISLFRSNKKLELREDFVETGSLGLPEFGTGFVRKMLKDTKPKVFSDLIRISGFSHGTDVWLNNAKDLILSGKVKLKEAISTRDDIMIYLLGKGLKDKVAFKIMEDVRKGRKVKPEYEEQMIENNVPQWYIDSCNTISYMFPKAHATAYVIMAFRLGYFKINFKEAFYASYFSVRGDAFDLNLFKDQETVKSNLERLKLETFLNAREKELKNILEIGYEMYLRDVVFTPISLYKSKAKRFIVSPEGLIPPFSTIPGLGDKVGDNIIRERLIGPFLSIEELQRRCKINNTLIEEMKKLGILDGLVQSAQLSLFD
ncbi:MAG: PolC-type DNA polymerase III [Firmicutes bacterium]|nr:PolC-type DNA polymerase III [Bacillota bacterium]